MKIQKSRQGSFQSWALSQAVFLACCFGMAIHPALSASSNTEKGKETYKTYCVGCHGMKGKGDGPAGKMLTPPPADFTSKKTSGKADEKLLATIGNGRPKTAMPPWKGTLSEQQMRDVLGYIRTLGN